MGFVSKFALLLGASAVVTFLVRRWRESLEPNPLAASGWPMLPLGSTPETIVLPEAFTIKYCANASCSIRNYSVLQDGGYRATYPEPQGRVTSGGTNLVTTYTGDNRFYLGQHHLAQVPDRLTSFEKDYVEAFDLTNKKLEFDVDMSKVGCNCDASLYFYAYNPASSEKNKNVNTTGDPMRNAWYLDAQSNPGVPELDVMEGCNKQFTSSIHTCKSQDGVSYSECGGMGEPWRAVAFSEFFKRKEYGPSGSVIDSNMKFRVSAAFIVEGEQWTMEVALSQLGSGAIKSAFKTGPRSDVSSLRWMRLAMSLWGSPDNGFLLTPFYFGQCNAYRGCDYKNAQVTYGNFEITEL